MLREMTFSARCAHKSLAVADVCRRRRRRSLSLVFTWRQCNPKCHDIYDLSGGSQLALARELRFTRFTFATAADDRPNGGRRRRSPSRRSRFSRDKPRLKYSPCVATRGLGYIVDSFLASCPVSRRKTAASMPLRVPRESNFAAQAGDCDHRPTF